MSTEGINSSTYGRNGELRERTAAFALRVIEMFRVLPQTPEAQVIGKQLLRSATSVAANYRAVQRARSKPEFLSKIGIVVEESDESIFWLELLVKSRIVAEPRMAKLIEEANELTAIFASSQRTARGK
jgi:four helix bundle protein